MVAAAVIGAGILGAGTSLIGSSEASGASKQAAGISAAAQAYQEQAAAPFVGFGGLAVGSMENMLTQAGGAMDVNSGAYGVAPSLNSSDIAQMPGYQFTQQQGLLATQNAAAAQGLGVSGNALAAASQYATNLASTNYQQYFNDYWANQNNRYNMLMGLTQVGENASVGSGSNVTGTSSAASQATQNAGTAAAAGTSGAGSSISNALLANALLGNQTGSTIPSGATGGGIANPAAGGSSSTIY